MADALCGPSNALQTFQKHSSVDRTLQQDRLTSRQTPSQGFRSGPGPNAGVLDPEFEAFQAGFSAGPPPQAFHHAPPHLSHKASQPNFATSPNLPPWASDFQRLQVSSPRPSTSHQSQAFSPPPDVTRQTPAAAWHQDFLQHSQASTPTPMHHAPIQPMYANTAHFGMQAPPYYEHNFAAAPLSEVAQGKQMAQEGAAQFDDAAFEAAFDQARAEILEGEDEMVREMEAEGEALRALWAGGVQSTATNHLEAQAQLENLQETAFRESQQDVLDDALDQALDSQRESDLQHLDSATDADALARTAGELLDSVADNTSAKFQQSQFLSLMRQLRDHEVRVQGDKLVENATPTPPTEAQALDPIPPEQQDTDDGRNKRLSTHSARSTRSSESGFDHRRA